MKLPVDYLFENYQPGGTYCSILPSNESKEALLNFCAGLGIDNLVDADEYHCSIICSDEPCPDVAKAEFGLPFEAIMKGFQVFGEESKVLVIELLCPDAKTLHDNFIEKFGATHKFPEYVPHITIAKDFTGELPEDMFDGTITFNGQTISELK